MSSSSTTKKSPFLSTTIQELVSRVTEDTFATLGLPVDPTLLNEYRYVLLYPSSKAKDDTELQFIRSDQVPTNKYCNPLLLDRVTKNRYRFRALGKPIVIPFGFQGQKDLTGDAKSIRNTSAFTGSIPLTAQFEDPTKGNTTEMIAPYRELELWKAYSIETHFINEPNLLNEREIDLKTLRKKYINQFESEKFDEVKGIFIKSNPYFKFKVQLAPITKKGKNGAMEVVVKENPKDGIFVAEGKTIYAKFDYVDKATGETKYRNPFNLVNRSNPSETNSKNIIITPVFEGGTCWVTKNGAELSHMFNLSRCSVAGKLKGFNNQLGAVVQTEENIKQIQAFGEIDDAGDDGDDVVVTDNNVPAANAPTLSAMTTNSPTPLPPLPLDTGDNFMTIADGFDANGSAILGKREREDEKSEEQKPTKVRKTMKNRVVSDMPLQGSEPIEVGDSE